MTGRDSMRTDIRHIADVITKGPKDSPAAAAHVHKSNRKALAIDLRAFGEDSVASAVEAVSPAKLSEIHARGMRIAFTGANISHSLCLAAVEVLEGKPRALARKRRKRAT